MKSTIETLRRGALALLLAAGALAGCASDGQFEETGEDIDEAIDDAADEIEDAADRLRD